MQRWRPRNSKSKKPALSCKSARAQSLRLRCIATSSRTRSRCSAATRQRTSRQCRGVHQHRGVAVGGASDERSGQRPRGGRRDHRSRPPHPAADEHQGRGREGEDGRGSASPDQCCANAGGACAGSCSLQWLGLRDCRGGGSRGHCQRGCRRETLLQANPAPRRSRRSRRAPWNPTTPRSAATRRMQAASTPTRQSGLVSAPQCRSRSERLYEGERRVRVRAPADAMLTR